MARKETKPEIKPEIGRCGLTTKQFRPGIVPVLGLGGGIYVTAGRTTLTLLASTINGNRADGGAGPITGKGVGGGLYITLGGEVYVDQLTLIFANDASTSDDDVFGILTPL